jgi:hypothetical protein
MFKRRRRLLSLVVLGLAGAILVVLRLRTPRSPIAEPRLPPPVVDRPRPPLQADAEGYYVPGYAFTVDRFRFTKLSLHPEALVIFAQTSSGTEHPVACSETLIRADIVHLRCDDPQVGIVTIDGRFLTRLVTQRLDAAVLSAVVTVRSTSGDVLYRARDSFEWHPAQ